MKVKIHKVRISLPRMEKEAEWWTGLTVEYKFHWWQRYKFVRDPQTKVPRLFENYEEINSFFDSIGFEGVWEETNNRVRSWKERTWTSVNDELPPIDEDVIVLSNMGRISFGHVVDPKIAVSHNGWNISDVAFWQPCGYTKEMLEYYEGIEV